MAGDFVGLAGPAANARWLLNACHAGLVGLFALGKGVRNIAALTVQRTDAMPLPLEQAFQEMRERRYAPSTMKVYRRCIHQFLVWLSTAPNCCDENEVVRRSLEHMRATCCSVAKQRLYLAACRTILDRILGLDFTEDLHYAPTPPRIVAITEPETQLLWETSHSSRERLAFICLAGLQLRPGQAVLLRRSDIDLDRGIVATAKGRNRRRVRVEVPRVLLPVLRQVLAEIPHADHLFPSTRSQCGTLTVRAFQKTIEKIGRRCGVAASCTALRGLTSGFPGPLVALLEQSDTAPREVPGCLAEGVVIVPRPPTSASEKPNALEAASAHGAALRGHVSPKCHLMQPYLSHPVPPRTASRRSTVTNRRLIYPKSPRGNQAPGKSPRRD